MICPCCTADLDHLRRMCLGLREAAEQAGGRRGGGPAATAAARQRRAQVEARGAAMRHVMRGLGAGQAGRALATWRRHCCQVPQPQQRLAPAAARPAPAWRARRRARRGRRLARRLRTGIS